MELYERFYLIKLTIFIQLLVETPGAIQFFVRTFLPEFGTVTTPNVKCSWKNKSLRNKAVGGAKQ